MTSEKGPKYIYAQGHKIYYYNYYFGGHWTEEINKIIFFSQALKWLLDFDWLLRSYDYLILTFYWFISAGVKLSILAGKMPDKVIMIGPSNLAAMGKSKECYYFQFKPKRGRLVQST